MARVTIYQSVLRGQTLTVAIRTVEQVLLETEFEAKRIAAVGPYATGALARSIRRRNLVVRGDVVTGELGSNLDYARIVHDGAVPHLIVPRGPGYPLRFYWRKVGHVVTPWSVNHPGQKGKKFLTEPFSRIAARHGWIVYTYSARP